jgi:hypothetical protein
VGEPIWLSHGSKPNLARMSPKHLSKRTKQTLWPGILAQQGVTVSEKEPSKLFLFFPHFLGTVTLNFGAISFAVQKFTINRVNKSGAVFDATKLK